MAKITILKTNSGTRMLGATQCSNGAFWDAEHCFTYCNNNGSAFLNEHQASKLVACSVELGNDVSSEKEWWKNRNNFIDVEIDYEVSQDYRG